MNGRRRVAWFGAVLSVAVLAGCMHTHGKADSAAATMAEPEPGALETALDAYVNKDDPAYRWSHAGTIEGDGYTGYVIDMVSQRWLDEETVDRPYWRHWLTICVPDEVRSEVGLLYIGGGSNDDDKPDEVPGQVAALATSTGTVVAELGQIPNQPLTFVWDDQEPRYEDSTIAYTWDKYLKTGDEKWPLRMPMTKGAVRAMDTITAFMASDRGGNRAVERFVVAGGSKRGWTTWTTAAVDERVVGIMPLVIDMLNLVPSFVHHYRVYGFYADAVDDYVEQGIMKWMGSEEYERLLDLVEPYSYRSRYTMPKYILNATGDQFFLPDSSQFYWDELPEEKWLRYVPNTNHGMGGSDVLQSMVAWYHALVHDVDMPEYSWSVDEQGNIHVQTSDNPSEVRLWRATNEDARNFQLKTIGESWASTVLPDQGGGRYLAHVEPPEEGWTAFFVELTFPSGTQVPFKFTTEVNVLPDEYPFEFHYPSEKDHAPGFLSKEAQAD